VIRQAQYSTEDLTARELAVQLGDQMAQLVRTEVALARAELFVATRQAMLGGAMLIGAAVVGACALLALIAAVIAAIATGLPVWAAALITGAVLLACGGGLASSGARRLNRATPPLKMTSDSLRGGVAELTARLRK
jgi:uncharacterized membrane protein YqjE